MEWDKHIVFGSSAKPNKSRHWVVDLERLMKHCIDNIQALKWQKWLQIWQITNTKNLWSYKLGVSMSSARLHGFLSKLFWDSSWDKTTVTEERQKYVGNQHISLLWFVPLVVWMCNTHPTNHDTSPQSLNPKSIFLFQLAAPHHNHVNMITRKCPQGLCCFDQQVEKHKGAFFFVFILGPNHHTCWCKPHSTHTLFVWLRHHPGHFCHN